MYTWRARPKKCNKKNPPPHTDHRWEEGKRKITRAERWPPPPRVLSIGRCPFAGPARRGRRSTAQLARTPHSHIGKYTHARPRSGRRRVANDVRRADHPLCRWHICSKPNYTPIIIWHGILFCRNSYTHDYIIISAFNE